MSRKDVAPRARGVQTSFLLVLLAGSLLLVNPGSASAGETFVDTDRSVHRDSIEAIAAKGITKGCNPPLNTLYCPDEIVSRGVMAAFLVRALGLTDDGGKDWFEDDDGHVFENDINRLAAAGITKGCNPPLNDSYCPDAPVTRGAVAAFLVRAFGYTDTGGGDLFDDDNGSIFENDIDKLGTARVTWGCNPPANDEFCPNDPVLRGAMATMLARALGILPVRGRLSARPAVVDEGSFDAVVVPGESIQNVVDSLPEGASVLIKAGTHVGQRVKPKSGMTFVGEQGAVLDGEGRVDYAFLAWEDDDADDVTIRGLEIKNYAPIPQMAAITGRRSGWVVEDCYIHHTIAGSAIRVQDNGVIRNCVVHDNDRLGLKPAGDNILVEGNEVYSNNSNDLNDPYWEAGGMKTGGDGVIVRNNHVYDNHGPGIWVDVDAIHVLYEDNLIEDNTHAGIHHEISYDAVIRNNIIRNNGHGDPKSDLRGAGIQIKGPNVEVYGNLLENNKYGVTLIENDRGNGKYGSYNVRNIYVHDNILVNSGENGAVRFNGSSEIFETSRFERNEYRYDNPNAKWWQWEGKTLAWEGWVSLGFDVNGSLAAN